MKTIIRDQKHRSFIKSLPCAKCKQKGQSDPAHIRKGADGGMGIKPSDNFIVPLCRECHRRQHDIGEVSFWIDVGKAHRLAGDLYKRTGNLKECQNLIILFFT